MKKIPVVILNGFLGSGKTTLFRNLLSQSKKKNISTCAIVNDMSQLDVDGELIASTAIIEENNKMFHFNNDGSFNLFLYEQPISIEQTYI